MWLRAKQPHKFWHATVGKVAGIHTVETTNGVLVSPTCRIPVLGERRKCTVRSIWSSRATSFNQHASLFLASHAEEFHLRVLPKPCMNLSIHTASDVRLPTYKKRQCEKSVGLAQRTRANHSLAPQCRRRRRLNFQRAQRTR